MNVLVTLLRCGALCSLMLIAACNQTNQPAPAGIQLSAPQMLLTSRRIDENQLRPVVTLSDGQTVNMSRSSTGGWTGKTTVVSNQSYDINITWIERYQDRDLSLATLVQNFTVGSDTYTLDIQQDNYDTSMDFDNDGQSNFDERQNDSDPFTAPNDTGYTGSGGTTGSDTGDTGSGGTTGSDSGDTGNGSTTGSDTGNTAGDALPTVLIPRIDPDDAPNINGQIAIDDDEDVDGIWAEATSVDINGKVLVINNLMVDINADHNDNRALRHWYAMHDDEYLYLLILSDDIGLRFSDSNRQWHDDSLEIFIDGNNSKLQTYVDDDDIQVTIPLLQINSTDANNQSDGRFSFGSGATNTTLDIEFSTGPGIGPDGIRNARWEQDIYEIRISLDSAGITVGEPFGLELQINDDDDGDTRDGKWGWFHPARTDEDVDTTYQNPSIMGTVILQ